MKISAVNFPQNNLKNYFKSPENNATQQFFTKPDVKQKSVNFSGEYFRAFLNIKNDFQTNKNNINFGNLYHKSISSTKPQYGLCECGYDDVDEFSKQFAKKINSQIQNPSLEDVENLISNVKNSTGADEKLVKEVIFRLSQFSTFNSMYFLKNVLYSRAEQPANLYEELNLARVMAYLAYKLYLYSSGSDYVSFIDDFMLSNIEKSGVDDWKKFGKKAYILDGFDIQTSEGKYAGANFLSGPGYLEALSIDVIKQIQSGRDIEDIMHGDLKKRAKKAFYESAKYYPGHCEIDVIRRPMPENISSKDILGNLKEKTLDNSHIARVIKTNADSLHLPDDDYGECLYGQDAQALLMKYLDNFAYVFSAHSMSEILNKMYQRLQELEAITGRKNMYVTPNTYKSFVIMTYMFMRNNQIGIENWQDYEDLYDYVGKRNFVILDDCSITGSSQDKAIKMVDDCHGLMFDKDIYYATIAVSQHLNRIYENANIYYLEVPDMIDALQGYKEYSQQKESEYSEILENNSKKWGLNYRDIYILLCNLARSYSGSKTCLAFPYMLPDNNADFSVEVLKPLCINLSK